MNFLKGELLPNLDLDNETTNNSFIELWSTDFTNGGCPAVRPVYYLFCLGNGRVPAARCLVLKQPHPVTRRLIHDLGAPLRSSALDMAASVGTISSSRSRRSSLWNYWIKNAIASQDYNEEEEQSTLCIAYG